MSSLIVWAETWAGSLRLSTQLTLGMETTPPAQFFCIWETRSVISGTVPDPGGGLSSSVAVGEGIAAGLVGGTGVWVGVRVGGGVKLPNLMDLTGVGVWADTTVFAPYAIGAKRIRMRKSEERNLLGITLIKRF